jgi:rhomboid protease GluP
MAPTENPAPGGPFSDNPPAPGGNQAVGGDPAPANAPAPADEPAPANEPAEPSDEGKSLTADDYLDAARHSLIYNEDFSPADWYFRPEISGYCWGLLSKTRGGTEYLVGLVPLSQDQDAPEIAKALAEEFFHRYGDTRTPAKLVLAAVYDHAPEEKLTALVAHMARARTTVDVVAIDAATKRIASPGEVRPEQPGARSLGFPQGPAPGGAGAETLPAEPPPAQQIDENDEVRRARQWFRQRARRSLTARGGGFSWGTPYVTNGLIVVNVIMLLIEELMGGSMSSGALITLGAKYTPLILAGQWWRLITYQFLHIGVMHLLFNGYALYHLGPLIEDAWGHWGFLTIYLLSGALGGLASAALSPGSVSAGASGALFGLLGAMAVFLISGQASWDLIWRTVGYPILATTVYGLLIRVDHLGHFGGLIGGFLIALGLGLGYQTRPSWRVAGAVGFVAVAAALLMTLLRLAPFMRLF